MCLKNGVILRSINDISKRKVTNYSCIENQTRLLRLRSVLKLLIVGEKNSFIRFQNEYLK